MSTDAITEEEASQALNGAGSFINSYICPECGREFASVAAMRGHLASHRGAQAERRTQGAKGQPAPPSGRQAPAVTTGQLLDAAGREVVRKAVKNFKTTGNLISFGAPHLGLAIAGQEANARTGALYVRSRAELAGELILEIRDPDILRQVLRVLNAFNALFEVERVAELGGSLVVAGAVDVRVIPPDFQMRVGPAVFPVAEATIGDVVAEWQRRGLYDTGPPGPVEEDGHPAWPPPGGAAGAQQPGAEVVQGGVENT